jgi:osomolarity two-component system sensor histidine kinase SLN1
MLKLEDIYDVVVAKDGQEAYDMVKESMAKDQLFNLIFMDIQVSRVGGHQESDIWS